jgi:hemerythrin-like domain-containing protein
MKTSDERRQFLVGAVAIPAGMILPTLTIVGEAGAAVDEGKDEEISPAEDLMREHGVLNRILLIYDEHLRRLEKKQEFDPGVLAEAAGIVRQFVEEYHEKLEEDFLFPRFRKAGKLVDLVDTLLQQHQAGRRVTQQIQSLAVNGTLKDEGKRMQLSQALQAFNRMYRPHEAREDTVVFPAFRALVSKHQYSALGDDFEKKEDQLFGEDGFFKVVDHVATLEKKLGIYELAQFTPR